MIGLEIDLKKIASAGRSITLTALVQICAGAILGVFFFRLCGFGLGSREWDALYLGVAGALSSTVIIVKVLYEKQELDTLTGRITLGVLVLQDLAAILFLAVQPNLEHLAPDILLLSLVRVVLLVAAALVASRYLLPGDFPARRAFAGAGPGWRAGLVFPGRRAGRTAPSLARDGRAHRRCSALDLSLCARCDRQGNEPARFLRDALLCRARDANPVPHSDPDRMGAPLRSFRDGQPVRHDVHSALPDATGSAHQHHPSDQPRSGERILPRHPRPRRAANIISPIHPRPALVALAFTLLAAVSTFGMAKSDGLARRLIPWLKRRGLRDLDYSADDAHAEGGHGLGKARIVFLGFFRTASSLLEEMQRHAPDLIVDVAVVDFSPLARAALLERKARVIYGDISQRETLLHAGVEHAEVFICTVPDSILKGTTNERLVRMLRSLNPKARSSQPPKSSPR